MTNQTGKIVPAPGARIGRWTVLEEASGPAGDRKWLCRCACGTEKTVSDRNLRYGGSLSCGCYRKERSGKANSNDLTGLRFGDLTVISRAENTKHGSTQWLCRCTCGNDCLVQGTLLTTGRKTRCSGSAHQKNYAYADVAGQRFGQLTALFPTGKNDRNGSIIWRCRCDCGNEIDLTYNTLAYTNQKSCGCRKKEHDQKLHTFLTHVAGTSVDALKSKKVPTDNTTGFKGVYFIRGKYVAKIVFQKKQYLLGSYNNIEDAAQARREAEELLFEGVAEHYRKWKHKADAEPEWAEQNPIQVIVNQENRRLQVKLLPQLAE